MVNDVSDMWQFVIALPINGVGGGTLVGGFGSSQNTLYGLWLERETNKFFNTSNFYRLFTCVMSCVTSAMLCMAMHSEILQYIYGFFVALSFHFLLAAIWNITRSLIFEFLVLIWWPIAFFYVVPYIICVRDYGVGYVFIAAVVFCWLLDAIKQSLQLMAFTFLRLSAGCSCPPRDREKNKKVFKDVVEVCYMYLCIYHRHQFAALLIMALHLCFSILLILLESIGGFHSWFLLNGNLKGGLLYPLIGGRKPGDVAEANIDRPRSRGSRSSATQLQRQQSTGSSYEGELQSHGTQAVGWFNSFRVE